MTEDSFRRAEQLAPRRRRLSWIEVLVACSIIVTLIAFLMPPVRMSREAARRVQCRNNLRRIGLALHNYMDVYGGLPPAYTVAADGKRLHSWRTLILPFADNQALYDKIDLTKPWDDQANAAVFAASPHFYHCPATEGIPANHTTYLAMVGLDRCLHPTESRLLSEITDEPAETLMVIEVSPQLSVHWMEPEDKGVQFLGNIASSTNFAHKEGVHAAFVDGRVKLLSVESLQRYRADWSRDANPNK